MKGKIFGVLAVFLIGLLALTIVNAADYNTDAFDNVELDDKDLSNNLNRLREYDRGEEMELIVDIIGAEVTNSSVQDARVEAFVRGDSHGDDVEDISDRFDIRSDRVYEKTLNLKVPSRMDRDVYTLTILLTSKEGVLAETSYKVSLSSGDEDHKLEIKDVVFSPEGQVEAGKTLLTTVKVQNKGTKDEEDVKVRVAIPALGKSAAAFISEVEAEDEDDDVVISEELYMRLPSDAITGDYEVEVSAEYDDGDEITTKKYMVHIEGVEPVTETEETVKEAKIDVLYVESQEITAGAAGKMYPMTIINPTEEAKTAIITMSGVDAFGSARVDPSNVVIIGAGETKMVPIYVSANEDAAAGEYTFTATISGLNADAQTVVMKANVAASEADTPDGWTNIKTGLEIALIVLFVLLVLLALIIGFGKLRSNDDDEDEGTQTYY